MIQFFCKPWIIWALATCVVSVGLAMGLQTTSEKSNQFATVYLPGKTTNGHYQIQNKCSACHDSNGVVQEQSCLDCHQQDLKEFKDTHPKSKFSDPTRLALLKRIDATNCLTCHKEHDSNRTHAMGLTVPQDFCWHCHKDVADERPSHTSFSFDSCLNAGCHNYHDNSALYENFLSKHLGEAEQLDDQHVLLRDTIENANRSVTASDADAPREKLSNEQLVQDWLETAHSQTGINCFGCHSKDANDSSSKTWTDSVDIETCSLCHKDQAETFLAGKHGMRIAADLPEMTPGQARLPMHKLSAHKKMNCVACHQGHRFDTQFAAYKACLQCHNDQHTQAYQESHHFRLWNSETSQESPTGTGVSCATCHMPRIKNDAGLVEVVHNQNWNLEPNEKMARTVCMNCHGLEFALTSLASRKLIENCFSTSPESNLDSFKMVQEWFQRHQK